MPRYPINRQIFTIFHELGHLNYSIRSLPEADRAKACIVTQNYGEAGVIKFYEKKYGLPLPVLSGHNQYHVWGPGRFTGEVVITVGLSSNFVWQNNREVQSAVTLSNPYMMPYEKSNPIYICREPKLKISDFKPRLKWLNV